jgi:hypothetical protein
MAFRYRVVFDLSVSGQDAWKHVLKNAENLLKALPKGEVQAAILAYGRGIGFVLQENTDLAAGFSSLTAQGVRFLACSNSLKAADLAPARLHPGIDVVDSGVAELVRMQTDGWAYIKVSGGD